MNRRTRPRPYVELRIGGFEMTIQKRPTRLPTILSSLIMILALFVSGYVVIMWP